MPPAKDLKPGASPSAFFGAELRHYRNQAGLSQEQLGERINYSTAQVGSVEKAVRKPQLDLAKRCDQVLETGGALTRLMEMVHREAFPAPFRPWVEAEQEATALRSWELAVVPGLLQTAEYARALLRAQPGVTEEQVEELVTARMERRAILEREKPPVMWYVIAEGVLRYQVGDAAVMREQLRALLESAGHSHVNLQVVPASAGAHPGLNGASVIASFDGAPDMVYLETAAGGQISDRVDDVVAMTNIYDAIRTEALPMRASLDLVEKVMEEWT